MIGDITVKPDDVPAATRAITSETNVDNLINGMSIEELDKVNDIMVRYRGMPDFVLKKFIECDPSTKELEIHHFK